MSEMCSVCIVRAQRDDDDFLPCSPACYRAALSDCEQRVLDAAREAVAGVGVRKDTSHDMRVQSLAAIDALREEKP